MTATLRTEHPAAALAREHLRGLGTGRVELTVDWAGPVRLPLVDEHLVQAACGIMHVHGRARGEPLPLAVDYATAVAGLLAAQGVLAAELGGARAVRTSVAQAALLSVGQYLASWPDEHPAGEGEPPPFVSADGVRFEIETLRAEDWQRFWRAVGAPEPALRRGWVPFLHRFATAVCPLPAALHDALARLPVAAAVAAGRGSGVSVVPMAEVIPGPLWSLTQLSAGPAPALTGGGAPLCGLRVVEATRRVQGPLAGHLLRMLGADVLRIEPPGGDPGRGTPRFAVLNAGKSVVELDLTTDHGRAATRELVADADVFVHNWAPGRAEAWRLDASDLAAVRPGLVYAAASGWGRALGEDPPLGTDYVVQAHSGLAAAARPPGEPPAPSLMTVTDVLGGLVCALGVLAGLTRRVGVRVDSSLLSATGAIPRRRPEFHRPLRTADGWVALPRGVPRPDTVAGSTTDDVLARLPGVAVTTDLGALTDDPRFGAAPHRPPWEFS